MKFVKMSIVVAVLCVLVTGKFVSNQASDVPSPIVYSQEVASDVPPPIIWSVKFDYEA